MAKIDFAKQMAAEFEAGHVFEALRWNAAPGRRFECLVDLTGVFPWLFLGRPRLACVEVCNDALGYTARAFHALSLWPRVNPLGDNMIPDLDLIHARRYFSLATSLCPPARHAGKYGAALEGVRERLACICFESLPIRRMIELYDAPDTCFVARVASPLHRLTPEGMAALSRLGRISGHALVC